MTPPEALKWADTFGVPFDDKPDGAAIALATLAAEVRRMRHRIECLRGGLKSASGWLLDADDLDGSEKCLEMAGDMEPPIMGSNVELTGAGTASALNAKLGAAGPGED